MHISVHVHSVHHGNNSMRTCVSIAKTVRHNKESSRLYKTFSRVKLQAIHLSCLRDTYHQSDTRKIQIIQHRAAYFVFKKPQRRKIRDSFVHVSRSAVAITISMVKVCQINIHQYAYNLIIVHLIFQCLPHYFQQDLIMIRIFFLQYHAPVGSMLQILLFPKNST